MLPSKMVEKDLYFIHIPKTGGIAFQQQFCNGVCGHTPIKDIPQNIVNNTIAIIRNPYSRFYSIYKYHTKEINRLLLDNEEPIPILHDLAQNNTFPDFVKEICVNNKFENDTYILPQIYWLKTNDDIILTKLIKLENINQEISLLLEYEVNMDIYNQSTENSNEYLDNYTDELKELVYQKYKDDFDILGYDK